MLINTIVAKTTLAPVSAQANEIMNSHVNGGLKFWFLAKNHKTVTLESDGKRLFFGF